MTTQSLPTAAPVDDRHQVVVYQGEDDLVGVAAGWFRDALKRGETVLVIATDPHRRAFRHALGALAGADQAIGGERILMLDAAQLLSEFMVGGSPDAELFDATVGGLVARTAQPRGLSAYGEMVALLWQDGNTRGALELEQLWNDLQEHHDFHLLCAYPTNVLVTAHDPVGYVDVASAHTSIFDGPPMAADAEATRHFPAHAGSPRLAREFVRATLEMWGLEALSDDAALVATELATNAIRHAGSHFAVSLARSAQRVRVAVGDVVAAAPAPRLPGPYGGGHGLHIVAATASTSGYQRTANGKLMWAELGPPGGREPHSTARLTRPGCPER